MLSLSVRVVQIACKPSSCRSQIRKFCAIQKLSCVREKEEFQGQRTQNALSHVFSQSRHFSRFSANTIMSGTDLFKINDYDCIGFDLDNTLVRYDITNMVKLEYEVLAKYLVEQKGHAKEFLYKPYDEGVDFLQKGLVLDFHRGNLLRLGADGFIQRAAHGTKLMTDAEIVADYGAGRQWDVTTEYAKNMMVAWNTPLEKKMRTLLDYFDMPSGEF
jgi:5' nucleotidase family